jgi:SAM-dependent methyltransferase
MSYEDEYYWSIARPYIRQATGAIGSDDEIFAAAKAAGLAIHYLKRIANPRIDRIEGMIQALWPRTLLDIGTGAGYILWRLSGKMPDLEMTAVDIKPQRIRRINQICLAAGVKCTAEVADAADLPFSRNSFDAACLLEVLEHVEDPESVMREALRVSKKDVFISVPCKPDACPEHIRLFTEESLRDLVNSTAGGDDPLLVISKDRNHYYAFVSKRSWTVSSEKSSSVRTSLGPRP